MTYELSRKTRRGGYSTSFGLTVEEVLAQLPRVKAEASVRLAGRVVGEAWLGDYQGKKRWLWYLETPDGETAGGLGDQEPLSPDGRPLRKGMCVCTMHCSNSCEPTCCPDGTPWCNCWCRPDFAD